jgi:hypothetical protein
MTTLREAAQQALEALWTAATPQAEEAITALKTALEQPEQEPVAWMCKGIPRRGCNYLNPCDTPCNKCGEIHHHHQMVAHFEAAQQPEQEQPVVPPELEAHFRHLDAVLEQQEKQQAEPVAWLRREELADLQTCNYLQLGADSPRIWAPCEADAPPPEQDLVPVYTHPPRREWQGLTEEEIWLATKSCGAAYGLQVNSIARAIEAALRSKNYG